MIAIGIVSSRAYAARMADRPTAPRIAGNTGWRFWNEFPEVERDEVPHRPDVLLGERIVRPESLVDGIDRLLRGERPSDRPSDIVGQDIGDDEDDRGEQPERDEREHEPAQEPACHRPCRTRDYATTVDVEGRGATSAPSQIPSVRRPVSCAEEHLPEGARVDALVLLRTAGEVVVEVRQRDRHVLVEDRLDLLAGGLLGLDADRRLEFLEGVVERLRVVLRRVPDALRLEGRIQVDVRRRAVTVVDDPGSAAPEHGGSFGSGGHHWAL